MLCLQGKLQVSLLWDPSKARISTESLTGRHPVYGDEATAHTPETKVCAPCFSDLLVVAMEAARSGFPKRAKHWVPPQTAAAGA